MRLSRLMSFLYSSGERSFLRCEQPQQLRRLGPLGQGPAVLHPKGAACPAPYLHRQQKSRGRRFLALGEVLDWKAAGPFHPIRYHAGDHLLLPQG